MINRFFGQHKKLSVVLLMLSAVFFAANFLFHRLALNHGKWMESFYSRSFYQKNSDGMNRFSNLFPFALGEFFVLMMVLLFLVILVRLLIYLLRKAYQRAFLLLSLLLFFISILLFHYTMAWGLNNYRMPAEELFSLGKEEITLEQLAATYEYLVQKTNSLVEEMNASEEGLLNPIVLSKRELLDEVWKGYEELAREYPFISPQRVRVKPLMISSLFSKSGYTGIYLYFFSEATINSMPSLSSIPFTAFHEIAHQKGFAGEDEASFIGFLAGIRHPKAYYQYSAYLGIMTYVGNSLYQSSPKVYQEIASTRREEILLDYQERAKFWDEHQEETVSKIHNKVNDAFLKANNQPDGILNYNRVTELIVKAYREGLF